MNEARLHVDVVSPGTRLRCVFEVTAGLIPGQPEAEFTKRWALTSESWEQELAKAGELGNAEGPIDSTFLRFQAEAMKYAADLMHPARMNWVRVDWVWM